MSDLLVTESARFALVAGISAIAVTSLVVVMAVRARDAKWKRLRMRGDPRAKARELQRRRR